MNWNLAVRVSVVLLLACCTGSDLIAQNLECGFFNAESVILTFEVTGGGTGTKSDGFVTISVEDYFAGEIHFRKTSPNDPCAATAKILPYTLSHKEVYRDLSGYSETITLSGPGGGHIPGFLGGAVPWANTWLVHPFGFFDGSSTIVRPGQGGGTFTRSLPSFPWGPEKVLIANEPIPPAGESYEAVRVISPDPASYYPSNISWTVTVRLSRGPAPEPIDPRWFKDPCYTGGSILGCENQSLGETIPLAGLPYRLSYSSDRFLPSTAPGSWPAHAYAAGGWSLTNHHYFDPGSKVLYAGDGSRRLGDSLKLVPAGSTGPAGSFLITGEGGGEVFLFDSSGRHLRTFEATTGSPRYDFFYLPSGKLGSIRDAFDRQMSIERDGAGQATGVTAPNGDRTVLSVGASGMLASVTNPAGGKYRLGYSPEGWLTSFTDPLDQTHRYTYNPDGRLVRDEAPGGRAVTLSRERTDDGARVTHANAQGVETIYEANQSLGGSDRTVTFPDGTQTYSSTSGAETSITMRDGGFFSITPAEDPIWGAAGTAGGVDFSTPEGVGFSQTKTITVVPASDNNPLAPVSRETRTGVDGQTWRSVYRSKERTMSVTSPLGRAYTFQYDEKGLPVAITRAGLGAARLSYDGGGRLTAIQSGEGASQRSLLLDYDARERLRSLTDPAGRVREFDYDVLNRPIARRFAGAETRHRYDALGRIIGVQPPGRPEHVATYTASGEVSAYVPPAVGGAGAQTSYKYNKAGALTEVSRLDGRTVKLARDEAGRVVSVDTGAGFLRLAWNGETGRVATAVSASGVTTRYTYDGPLLTSLEYFAGVAGQVQMTYGPAARLLSVSVPGAGEYMYGYDADGLLTQAGDQIYKRDAASGLLTSSTLGGVTAEWKYNSFGETTSHTERAGAGVVFQTSYTRDVLGRIVTKSESLGGETSVEEYQYDEAGRLGRAVRNGQELARYEYDTNGNRSRAAYGGADRAATHDEQDRLLAQGETSYSYTPDGEVLTRRQGGETTTFVFDGLSELRSARLASGKNVEYLTDAAGRRVGRKVDGRLESTFLYHPDGVPAAWLDASGAPRALFIYGRRAHVPDSMVRGGVLYRIVIDNANSVRLVVNAETGEIVQRIDYDPYGRVTRDTNPGFQPFGFAGGMPDPDTGLVRFGFRDYDPEAGRWTSKDPLYFAGGSANLYQYAGNDPVNRGDPSGLLAVEISFGVVGIGITYQPGVGVSGAITVGVGSPGVSISPGGTVFVPVNAQEGFISRDAKVTIEGKASVGIGSLGSVTVSVSSEEMTDKYGYHCGEYSKWTPKAEACAAGACVDTSGESKTDVGKTTDVAGGKGGTKVEAGVEAGAKLEFLIWQP